MDGKNCGMITGSFCTCEGDGGGLDTHAYLTRVVCRPSSSPSSASTQKSQIATKNSSPFVRYIKSFLLKQYKKMQATSSVLGKEIAVRNMLLMTLMVEDNSFDISNDVGMEMIDHLLVRGAVEKKSDKQDAYELTNPSILVICRTMTREPDSILSVDSILKDSPASLFPKTESEIRASLDDALGQNPNMMLPAEARNAWIRSFMKTSTQLNDAIRNQVQCAFDILIGMKMLVHRKEDDTYVLNTVNVQRKPFPVAFINRVYEEGVKKNEERAKEKKKNEEGDVPPPPKENVSHADSCLECAWAKFYKDEGPKLAVPDCVPSPKTEFYGSPLSDFMMLEKYVRAHGKNPAKMRLLDAMLKKSCLLYTSPSPRDGLLSRMPSSA